MLDDETRMLLIAHALTGSVHGSSDEPAKIAKRAIGIADAVLRLVKYGDEEPQVADVVPTPKKEEIEPEQDAFREGRRAAASALVKAVAEAARQAGYDVVEQPVGQYRIRPSGQNAFEAHVGVHADGRPLAGAGGAHSPVPSPHNINPVIGIRFDPVAGIFVPDALDPDKPQRDAFAIVAEHVASLIKGAPRP
jgi:hypothetical protein